MSPLFHNTVYQDLGLNWGYYCLESTDMEVFLKARQDPNFFGE
jgi:quinate dehydrogenase